VEDVTLQPGKDLDVMVWNGKTNFSMQTELVMEKYQQLKQTRGKTT